jgi:SAM-dependent methyltransferase
MSLFIKLIENVFNHKTIIVFFILVIMLIIIRSYNSFNKSHFEGFTQDIPFVIKRNDDIYDDFYAEVYNKIFIPEQNASLIVDSILNNCNIIDDKNNNFKKYVFLFISTFSCAEAKILDDKAFNTFTIDKSQQMVDYAKQKYENIQIKVGNIQNPMIYDSSTFTHISCLGFNIYRIQDKILFFRNIYNFLIPLGYFIIQISDRSTFGTIVPAGKSLILESPQNYSDERITETEIDFGNFTYNSKYDFSDAQNKNIVMFTEKFIDSSTQNVRMNEQTMFFEEKGAIIDMIIRCGFALKLEVPLKTDENQSLYIFKRVR